MSLGFLTSLAGRGQSRTVRHEQQVAGGPLASCAFHFITPVETLTDYVSFRRNVEGVWYLGLKKKILSALLIHPCVSPRKNVISLPEGMGSEQGQAWSSPHHRPPFRSSDVSYSLGPQGLCTAISTASNVPPLAHSASFNQL